MQIRQNRPGDESAGTPTSGPVGMGSSRKPLSTHPAGAADLAAAHPGIPGYRALQPAAVAGHSSSRENQTPLHTPLPRRPRVDHPDSGHRGGVRRRRADRRGTVCPQPGQPCRGLGDRMRGAGPGEGVVRPQPVPLATLHRPLPRHLDPHCGTPDSQCQGHDGGHQHQRRRPARQRRLEGHDRRAGCHASVGLRRVFKETVQDSIPFIGGLVNGVATNPVPAPSNSAARWAWAVSPSSRKSSTAS